MKQQLIQLNDGSESTLSELVEAESSMPYKKHYDGPTLWESILRCIWIGIFVAAAVLVLKAMSWADKGIRGEAPIEQHHEH
jgi:hypothetical protein